LNAKDRESNTSYAELANTEDFLASHVLRVPGGVPPSGPPVREATTTREAKNKAKQYSTINGRTVIVKESFVYSNKGFKTLNQAQLLQDTIYYPDTPDGQQWLVYYISRPLVGSFLAAPVVPAIISDEPSKKRKKVSSEASASANTASNPTLSSTVPKKQVKGFADLMNQFPMISRQMQSGLEQIIRDFVSANDSEIPKQTARRLSTSSHGSNNTLGSSVSSLRSSLSGSNTLHPTSLELEPGEETMRTSLQAAVASAIELFQKVDKNQLALLGSNTELTGPVVEKMLERYVVEQVHDQTLFPRICAIRKTDDTDLEYKIRQMSDVDISQVGIPIEDGTRGKRELAVRLSKGIEAFKKMGVASSPLEMLEILLDSQKLVTEATPSPTLLGQTNYNDTEKTSAAMTVNADILVSMLVVVVIRSAVRHLHSRLLCMRYFIFTEEVESGEQGYALATLEAVLAHLSDGSSNLRRASRRNRLLWQATKSGDVQALETILQPNALAPSEVTLTESLGETEGDPYDVDGAGLEHGRKSSPVPGLHLTDFVAVNGSLEHVFPFQRPPTPPPENAEPRGKKRVSMADLPRSHSASSAFSSRSHSRHLSMDSGISGRSNADFSTDRLAHTQDADGNSILMMAVESRQAQALRCLLDMPAHFRVDFVMQDANSNEATLLNVAVQSGDTAVTEELLDYFEQTLSEEDFIRYLAVQDNKGRCMAHHLFTQPHLLKRFGKKLPWRLKDTNGQTPLFALCRSYDHEQYHSMVDLALSLATESQGNGEALHLDDHVDLKSNTLLHIINDAKLAIKLLRYCDADVNATNDKRFTPFMVGSKYGRIDLVKALFGDPRVDLTLKDIRGLTAVELAKDDEMRNRIDDLMLLSTPPGQDGRITTVVRAFFLEDATVRFVLKSGAPSTNGMITVTTCRRSVADFEALAKLLALECPASWIPTNFNLPSPFMIPSKPSRTLSRDTQIRLDSFLRNLISHGTFSTHELVWEFFLVPDVDVPMLSERSKRKAETRVDHIKDDFEPVSDTQEVETFVEFVREQMRGVTSATKKVIRSTNRQRMLNSDLAEASSLASARVSSLLFLPQSHITAFERYARTLVPTESSPSASLYYSLHSMQSSSTAISDALDRPSYLIGSMSQVQRAIDRNLGSLSRSNRWTPNIGLFEDAKKQVALDAWDKAAKSRRELENLGRELRYTQQTVASELAAWQEEHARAGKAMLRRFARETVVKERARLDGMLRALREIRKTQLV